MASADRLTFGQLRAIAYTTVRARSHCYRDPELSAEVAARVTRYILAIPDRFCAPGMGDAAHEDEVVIDVMTQVLQDIELEEQTR